MHRLLSLFRRFRSDESGAFIVIFGIIGIVLVAMSGAVVDYVSIEQSRTRAQVALDAAALALQADIYRTNITVAALQEELRGKAQALLLERMDERPGKTESDPRIWKVCDKDADKPCAKVSAAVVDKVNGKLTLTAEINVPLYFVALVGVDHMRAGLLSEATRGSMNVEVAVALDTTGSMSGQRIIDLKDATKLLINEVVQDTQTPTYSKVALVPYSMGVNLGTYADAARGTLRKSTTITNIGWAVNAVTISSVAKTNPVQVTTTGTHNLSTGDRVFIYNTLTSSSISNQEYTITKINDTKFSLNNVNGTASGFTVPLTAVVGRCITLLCELVVTSANHGLNTNDYVFIDGVTGADPTGGSQKSIKSQSEDYKQVRRLTADTYAIPGTLGYYYSSFISGGNSWCTEYGCDYYRYLNPSLNVYTRDPYNRLYYFRGSTCVSERTGAQAFTDAATSGNPVGLNYPAYGNDCITAKIQPLTSDKTVLEAAANSLSAGGSTAAQVGIAWAWYAVSPNVGSIFPTASVPAAYTAPKTRKIVILMTDGEFNSPYCVGAIAKDAGSGSGDERSHSWCNAPNGSAYDQSEKLCDAMKKAGVTVYTVGFDIANIQRAKDLMANCATDSTKAYNAANGAALKAAFQEIGASIGALRISK